MRAWGTRAAVAAGLGFAAVTFAASYAKVDKFRAPDIRDDYCGAKMDFRYCKCAFHNEYCKDIGQSKSAANSKVQAGYKAWVDELRAAFKGNCEAAGGIFASDECRYCKEGTKAVNGKCVDAEEAADLSGPINPKTCQINALVFDSDWKKYSDLDDRIAPSDRSFEGKEHAATMGKIVDAKLEIFLLERDMEVDRLVRVELREYKQALVQNIKTNLLKSFWRLAWVTYDTIDANRGMKGSFEKVLDFESVAEVLAAKIKLARQVTPGDSKLAINTDSVTGKVKSVGLSAALDALESVGDPLTIATTVVSESVKSTFGSADLTDEEVEILRQQHLKNRGIDDVLQESYLKNRARRLQADALKQQASQFQNDLVQWEAKEKDRVKSSLIDACQKEKAKSNQ